MRCYDLRGGTLTTDTLDGALTNLALSSDGECVLVGGIGGKLRLLDGTDGQMLAQYEGTYAISWPVGRQPTS